jgi:Glyoxalase-like domain
MIGRLYAYVIDCPDPAALGAFYEQITGYELLADNDYVVLRRDGVPRIAFQPAPDHRAPRWPDPAYPQQTHLDLFVDDLDEAERSVLALGATRLADDASQGFRVYADPAGHPFCLCLDDPTAP